MPRRSDTRPAEARARFRAALENERLLEGVGRLLVACSGGADSTALLLLLAEHLRGRHAACELWVGHVHHGIRGEEADRDEGFVRRLAARHGLPCLVERADVPRLAKERGLSLETAGRELRYAAFRRWAGASGIDAFALAHHEDDQRETRLLRLVRGTGLSGLRGMRPSRPLEGAVRPARVIRPLLGLGREELRALLAAAGEAWREDATNLERAAARNRVRLDALPALERVHPGARAAIDRLGEIASETADDLRALAARALDEARAPEGEPGHRAAVLRGWPRSVRREVLVLLAAAADPAVPPPGERALARFDALLAREDGNAAGDLGAGLRAERRGSRVRVTAPGRADSRSAGDASREASLPLDGSAVGFGAWRIAAERGRAPPPAELAGPAADRWVEWIPAGALRGPLEVRTLRPGERFRGLGAPGHKRVERFLADRGVPPGDRGRWPLVVCGGEVAWVVGHRLGEAFRLPPGGGPAVRLAAWRAAVPPAGSGPA